MIKKAKSISAWMLFYGPQKWSIEKSKFSGAYFESTWCCHLLAETNQTAAVYTHICSLSENTFKIMIEAIVTEFWGVKLRPKFNFVKF